MMSDLIENTNVNVHYIGLYELKVTSTNIQNEKGKKTGTLTIST